MAGGFDHDLNPAARMLIVLAIAAAFALLIGGLLGTRQVAHLFQSYVMADPQPGRRDALPTKHAP